MQGLVPTLAHWAADIIELIGISFLLLSSLYTLIYGGIRVARRVPATENYHVLRRTLGRGILLGLEFLVAADIIMTVAVELTFERVGALALIVIVRTFLSFALEVEMTGNWPWQNDSFTEQEAKRSAGDH